MRGYMGAICQALTSRRAAQHRGWSVHSTVAPLDVACQGLIFSPGEISGLDMGRETAIARSEKCYYYQGGTNRNAEFCKLMPFDALQSQATLKGLQSQAIGLRSKDTYRHIFTSIAACSMTPIRTWSALETWSSAIRRSKPGLQGPEFLCRWCMSCFVLLCTLDFTCTSLLDIVEDGMPFGWEQLVLHAEGTRLNSQTSWGFGGAKVCKRQWTMPVHFPKCFLVVHDLQGHKRWLRLSLTAKLSIQSDSPSEHTSGNRDPKGLLPGRPTAWWELGLVD